MEFLNPIWHSFFLIVHIISVAIAIGSVSVTDYFHLIGLKKKNLEKKMLFVYPILGKMILFITLIIIITGIILLVNKPSLLKDPIFQLKLILFGVVLINGFVLHVHVFPHITKCVLHKQGYCPVHVLWTSSFSGSLSVVTWYSILILALTKNFAYEIQDFLIYYLIALIVVFLVAFYNEERSRIWKF